MKTTVTLRVRALIAGTLATLLLATVAAADHGSLTRHTFPNGNHTRDYLVYVPPDVGADPVPMIVYLHGCSQDADDVAVGTRFNAEADRRGMIVVYPEQNTTSNQSQGNGLGCWNWFRPDHQFRGQGEPSTIAGITQLVAQTQNVDPRRIYILGASAGADMAVIMGATYPDLYAAIGALAGCPYLSCTDEGGDLAYAAMGQYARPVPVLVMQGTADTTNPYPAGTALVQQWLGTNDFADDGLANSSVSRLPAATDTFSSEEGNGFAYRIEHYEDADACPLLDYWIVEGMGHVYPSGDPQGSFTTPDGPDITAGATDFFLAHPMLAAGVPLCLPEPGEVLMLASGIALLAALGRRRTC